MPFDGSSRGVAQRNNEAKGEEGEHVDVRDPDIPYRVDTARGRHVTPNIGRKPKLITTASILLEMPSIPASPSESMGYGIAHELAIIDVNVVHVPFSRRCESIPVLSPSLCLAKFPPPCSGNSVSEQPHQGDSGWLYGPRRGTRGKRREDQEEAARNRGYV